ncbi:MAG: sugar ABC transporter ATP-binding protein [Clostridia bacterium]
MDAILEMCDICKTFGVVKALDNVCLTLRYHEILGLVGENGAGKSTLMKILSGSYPHSSYSGIIKVEGEKQQFSTPFDSAKAGIEMIYQEISMHGELNIAENIFLGNIPSIKGFIRNRTMIEESKKYLEMVGLDLNPTTLVRNLSTSQQQMIAIARALSRNPKILILDEPTSALTETECELLHQNLTRFKERGISCIYISHKLKEVFNLCDRITTLRDGKTIHTSNVTNEMEQTPGIIEEMIGRKIDVMYPKQKVAIGEEILRVEHLTIPSDMTRGADRVKDVGFKVHAGEIVAIAGLVGAGRSETVNAVFGACRKSSGDIYVCGNKVNIRSPKDAIVAGIGLVTEDRRVSGLITQFSIKENISVASLDDLGSKVWMNKKREEEVAVEAMHATTIKAPSINTMITKLSGGNQQKVVLAKWLAKDLKVLILDEPTRGVDVGAKAQIYAIMTEMAKRGMAIVMISSELPELIAMCDRMYVMADGRITAEMSGADITETNMMKAATGF